MFFVCSPLPFLLFSSTHTTTYFLSLLSSVSLIKSPTHNSHSLLFKFIWPWSYMIDFLPTLSLPSNPLLLWCLLLVISCAYVSLLHPTFFHQHLFQITCGLLLRFYFCAHIHPRCLCWLLSLYMYIPSLMLPHFIHPQPLPSPSLFY